MIRLTRLDGSELTINCDLLETVEHTPDTVISLLNNHKLVVRESVDEVIDRVVEYRQKIHLCPLLRERFPWLSSKELHATNLPREGSR